MQHPSFRVSRYALAVASALLASACAPKVRSAVFMTAPPTPSDQDVRIYRTQMPRCAYDELGVVTWPNASRKLQAGVEKMRARAREMGGHAIVGFSMGERINGTTTTVSSDSSHTVIGSSVDLQTLVSGTVIRFRDALCMQ
jgi:hypothetical protein